jgi:biotin synthase-related radical SAM superfamily protein
VEEKFNRVKTSRELFSAKNFKTPKYLIKKDKVKYKKLKFDDIMDIFEDIDLNKE